MSVYVCVYLESLIGTRYLIWECGVVSKPPKNTAKAIWAQKFLVKCQASKNRVFGILKVNQRKNWLECKLCVIFFFVQLCWTLYVRERPSRGTWQTPPAYRAPISMFFVIFEILILKPLAHFFVNLWKSHTEANSMFFRKFLKLSYWCH